MKHATRARSLMVLACAASLPPVVLLLASGSLLHAVELAAAHRHAVHRGCAGLCRGAQAAADRPRPPRRRLRFRCSSSPRSWASSIWFDAHPISGVLDSGGVVDVLFVPLVIDAGDRGGQPAEAAVDPVDGVRRPDLVLPVHGARAGAHRLGWAVHAVRAQPWHPTPHGSGTSSACSRSPWCVSILLYHFVEEPARRWMRRMVDTRDVRAANAETEPGESATPNFSPIDGGREAVSAKRYDREITLPRCSELRCAQHLLAGEAVAAARVVNAPQRVDASSRSFPHTISW